MARVIAADDDPLARMLLRLVLERADDFELVGEAADTDATAALLRQHRPDLLLIDVNMPGPSLHGAIPILRAASPTTRVLVLSSVPDVERLALTIGADGGVAKGLTPAQLLASLRAELSPPAR